MSYQPCISIIIPFYNSIKHIDSCLNGLINQSFKKMHEIIFVNDGSTDETVRKIENYKNPLIKIFELKKNKGPAAARNLGLKNASGKYVFFLDVDDTISLDILDKLYNEVLEYEYDIIFCDKKWIENSQNQRANIFLYPDNKILNSEEIKNEMRKRFKDPISNVGIFGLTGRLIKRNIIINNNIFFDEKLRYLEDETFSWQILSKVKSIKYLKLQLYNYNVNPNINTALSEGLSKNYPISNFKIAKNYIKESLRNVGFNLKTTELLSNQAYIFFIISALVSLSKSIELGKIEKSKGKFIRSEFIKKIIDDKEIPILVKNYEQSKLESYLIPLAIKLKSKLLLEYATAKRARQILSFRRKNT